MFQRRTGSPPHAWGDCDDGVGQFGAARFTPTRVGRLHARHRPFAYPVGSPPHAWGDCNDGVGQFGAARFTPTRVGRFRHPCRHPPGTSVHPHTRGEIALNVDINPPHYGSPPHAWGDSGLADFLQGDGRFTPTRVGRFCHGGILCLDGSVHPHTRGEIMVRPIGSIPRYGSPPHAWGDSVRDESDLKRLRFTPTRVGRFCTG